MILNEILEERASGGSDQAACLPAVTEDSAAFDGIASATTARQASNSVELDLETTALSLRLKSEAPDQKAIQARAQLELLLQLYAQANAKLEASMKRIGYLEARLADYE